MKKIIHTELPKFNVIFSNIISRSNNSIAMLKISNFNKHLNYLKMDVFNNSNTRFFISATIL